MLLRFVGSIRDLFPHHYKDSLQKYNRCFSLVCFGLYSDGKVRSCSTRVLLSCQVNFNLYVILSLFEWLDWFEKLKMWFKMKKKIGGKGKADVDAHPTIMVRWFLFRWSRQMDILKLDWYIKLILHLFGTRTNQKSTVSVCCVMYWPSLILFLHILKSNK